VRVYSMNAFKPQLNISQNPCGTSGRIELGITPPQATPCPSARIIGVGEEALPAFPPAGPPLLQRRLPGRQGSQGAEPLGYD